MNASLTYQSDGSGPALLLIHGTGSTGPASWGPLLPALTTSHRVILPDLPGSGATPLPSGPLVPDEIVDQVLATADDAGVETFAVAGASLGSPLAIRLATRHPERVTKVISIVGYAAPRPVLRFNLELWADMFARHDPNLGKLIADLAFSDPGLAALGDEQIAQITAQLVASPAPGTAAQINLALTLDVRDDLEKVQAPTLVIAGADDRFVPPAHSRQLADGIARALYVEVPGGHAEILRDPSPTLDAVRDFLA